MDDKHHRLTAKQDQPQPIGFECCYRRALYLGWRSKVPSPSQVTSRDALETVDQNQEFISLAPTRSTFKCTSKEPHTIFKIFLNLFTYKLVVDAVESDSFACS